MVRSSILGPDGQPMERTMLSSEVATPTVMGVRQTLADTVAAGLSPERLAAILRGATIGHMRDYLTLAEEMEERYLHYASQVQTRRLAIEGVEISVEAPKGMPAKFVDAVHSLVQGSGLLEAIGTMTDGIAKGFSIVELMWEYQGGVLQPVDYHWRDQRFFQFDRVSMTELRLAVDHNLDGEELPAGKFIWHMPRSKTGIPIRRGFARAATWAFLVQSLALKDWSAFAEVYGMPFRIGKYHASATAADKRTLLRAVASIANDAAAIIPAGMDIEFHEVSGSQGAAVFGDLTDYLDRSISKLVVGQTMTADDGASMAQAKVHNEVRIDILRADCRQLANTLNRDLIPWFIAMNFGPQDSYPQLTMPVSEPDDIKALTSAVKDLVPLGLRVSQREIRSRIGISEPTESEELLVAPRVPEVRTEPGSAELSAHVAGCRCGSCLRTARLAADRPSQYAVDDVDSYVDEVMEGWEPVLAPMIDKLLATAKGAASFEDLLDLVDGLDLDSRPLAEKLAIATSIARGLGDIKD